MNQTACWKSFGVEKETRRARAQEKISTGKGRRPLSALGSDRTGESRFQSQERQGGEGRSRHLFNGRRGG